MKLWHKKTGKHLFAAIHKKLVKRARFLVFLKNNFSRVVWAEESKNGIRFEIGPSYDDVPTTSQCLTDGQPSCSGRGTHLCLPDIPLLLGLSWPLLAPGSPIVLARVLVRVLVLVFLLVAVPPAPVSKPEPPGVTVVVRIVVHVKDGVSKGSLKLKVK